ncbi:uncharacterized protein N7477_001576 [Penicillium maclennaniae]|uniref:uncharacterized protein n=1 Tax=Penicillium maclennaniae TaxID=1343394 RepID=UPI002540C42F|nr:uncharacterized protein N7477_001576 [Penicillium maclennaniae]KAJ5681636.1 hypothetical protein N7477_001576 [Penicillium maclennaniae]
MCFRSSDDDKYPAARSAQGGNEYDRYLRDRDRYQKELGKKAKQKKKRNRNTTLFTSNTAMMGGAGC